MVAGKSLNQSAEPGARLALLLAAERLFAVEGFTAVSIRRINEAAGARNTSAIYYHFDDRVGLINAIFDYRFAHMNPIRTRMLAALDAEGGADVRTLTQVLIEPLAREMMDGGVGAYYARFLDRCLRETPGMIHASPDVVSGIREVETRLRARMDGLPPSVAESRIHAVRHLGFSTLARLERQVEAGELDAARFWIEVQLLIDALFAMITAELSPESRQAMAT